VLRAEAQVVFVARAAAFRVHRYKQANSLISSVGLIVRQLTGSVYSADLDGKSERNFLHAQGNLTGIAYAAV